MIRQDPKTGKWWVERTGKSTGEETGYEEMSGFQRIASTGINAPPSATRPDLSNLPTGVIAEKPPEPNASLPRFGNTFIIPSSGDNIDNVSPPDSFSGTGVSSGGGYNPPQTFGPLPAGRPGAIQQGGFITGSSGSGAGSGGSSDAPTVPEMPKFEMPTWDEGEISSLQQQLAAPTLRKLRQQIREAQNAYYDNPNVKRMTLRDALAGYGMGVEEAMAGSRAQATSEYNAKYGREFSKAQTEYQGQLSMSMVKYQAAWNEYLTRLRGQLENQRMSYAKQLG